MDYNFNEKSFDELKDIKAEVMEIMKGKREEKKDSDKEAKLAEQEAFADIGKGLAKIGNTVACKYKNEDVLGTITKINERTVTVKITDVDGNAILNKDGKQVVTWKYLYQIFEV